MKPLNNYGDQYKEESKNKDSLGKVGGRHAKPVIVDIDNCMS
jgi:hypothetical protein